MFQHDFQFFVYLMMFSPQKKKKWSNIPFSYLFFTFVQNFKQINMVMTCVFECFESHGHILKQLHEFLCMMSAITIFGKNSFKFNFVNYGLVTK
jgi:hypothetical protein